MKSGNGSVSESAAAPAGNGKHRGRKKNGAAPTQPCEKANSKEMLLHECLAEPICETQPAATDSPAWPLHSAIWLQPDGAPSAPAWSGLAVEHQNRSPVPEFQPCGVAPLDMTAAAHNSRDALIAPGSVLVPETDLRPLGWDPRAVCWKDGKK